VGLVSFERLHWSDLELDKVRRRPFSVSGRPVHALLSTAAGYFAVYCEIFPSTTFSSFKKRTLSIFTAPYNIILCTFLMFWIFLNFSLCKFNKVSHCFKFFALSLFPGQVTKNSCSRYLVGEPIKFLYKISNISGNSLHITPVN